MSERVTEILIPISDDKNTMNQNTNDLNSALFGTPIEEAYLKMYAHAKALENANYTLKMALDAARKEAK